MESKLTELIKIKKETECSNLFSYAALVADLELLSNQNDYLFPSDSLKEAYRTLWNKMEIINSCALDEWEEKGRPKDFSKIWNEKYKYDATKMLYELIEFIEKLEI